MPETIPNKFSWTEEVLDLTHSQKSMRLLSKTKDFFCSAFVLVASFLSAVREFSFPSFPPLFPYIPLPASSPYLPPPSCFASSPSTLQPPRLLDHWLPPPAGVLVEIAPGLPGDHGRPIGPPSGEGGGADPVLEEMVLRGNNSSGLPEYLLRGLPQGCGDKQKISRLQGGRRRRRRSGLFA